MALVKEILYMPGVGMEVAGWRCWRGAIDIAVARGWPYNEPAPLWHNPPEARRPPGCWRQLRHGGGCQASLREAPGPSAA